MPPATCNTCTATYKTVAPTLGAPPMSSPSSLPFARRDPPLRYLLLHPPHPPTFHTHTRHQLRALLPSSLLSRDLRLIDPSFSSPPSLLIRQNAILINLPPIRSLILHDRILILSGHPVVSYIQKMSGSFQFCALEGVLVYLQMAVEREWGGVEAEVKGWLGGSARLRDRAWMGVNKVQARLMKFDMRIHQMQRVLQQVLDDDHDLDRLYLGPTKDHIQAEVLLETCLQAIDDLSTKTRLLKTAIDDTENLVEIHLDVMQNQLLFIDIIIATITAGLSFATMITAMMGMNTPLPSFLTGGWWGGVMGLVAAIMLLGIGGGVRWALVKGGRGGRW